MDLDEAAKVKIAILFFVWLEYFWELYLTIRQLRVCQKTTQVPKELKDVMKDDTFHKARLYTIDKSYFSLVKDLFSTLITTCVFLTGALAYIWDYSNTAYTLNSEVLQSCVWLLILQLISTVIGLPFSVYYTFILEEQHGFNKQTYVFFIKDKIKAFVVTQIINLPIAALTIVIIKNGGDFFFVWLWLFVGIVVLILLTVYPAYIAPLFDKYTPLPEGELRQSIENLASQLSFPLSQLYVVEGSKRSAHSNAYFYGLFGSKRIVLFDTLLGTDDKPGCTNEEIVAVLSHELGHWKHSHVTKNLIIMQVNLFLMFAAFSIMFTYGPVYEALGFPSDVRPVLAGLVAVLQFLLAPYNTLLGFLLTVLSRRFEFQADAFAVQLGKAKPLKSSLIQLNKENLGFPIYDPLYSAWHHSHPPLLERIDRLSDSKKD